MTVDDSYAIQRAWMDLKRARGRVAVGHKIGLTSRAMQLASQISEPDFGLLLDGMVLRDGSEIEAARYIVPRLEVEFAFILAKPLKGPGVSLFDVLNATDYVVPALELIDARIEQFDRASKAPRKVLDTIADNAANAAIILGGRPVRADAVDLRWAGALLYKNGVIEESGLGAAVLNHPSCRGKPSAHITSRWWAQWALPIAVRRASCCRTTRMRAARATSTFGFPSRHELRIPIPRIACRDARPAPRAPAHPDRRQCLLGHPRRERC